MPRYFQGNGGQALPIALLLLLIGALLTRILAQHVHTEAKWSVKSRRSKLAFHLAEAGIARGIWKLNESNGVFTNAKNGAEIAGYNDHVEYDDIPGGTYKIQFISGPSSNQVTITAKGKDAILGEVRSIEAIVARETMAKAWTAAGNIRFKNGVLAHWGPVTTFQSLRQVSDPLPYFPRKYAASGIEERDEDPGGPNSDGVEYWAYYQELGEKPKIDLEYYREKARNSSVPVPQEYGSDAWTANPPGSGYIDAISGFSIKPYPDPYTFICSTCALYFAGGGTVKIQQDFYIEADMIFEGSVHLDNWGRSVEHIVPVGASQEYQHPIAQATWDTLFGTEGTTVTIDNVFMKGFLYVGDDWDDSGNDNAMIGAGYINGDININTVTLYYDPQIAGKVKLGESSLRKISWREVSRPWGS